MTARSSWKSRSSRGVAIRDSRNAPAAHARATTVVGLGHIGGDQSRPFIRECLERDQRLDLLDTRAAERGIDKEHCVWYRDLHRYGTVPHAGFRYRV
jgi:hypothetical protein